MPPKIEPGANTLTPDDIMDGRMPPKGRVVVYDDDQIYLAGILAEKLVRDGYEVVFATPASIVSSFTQFTLEQARIQSRLLELGVTLMCNRTLVTQNSSMMRLACSYTGQTEDVTLSASILVTERVRQTDLFNALHEQGGLKTLELIGDAASPGLIADAVYAGHMAARNFERKPADIDAEWFRRELVSLSES